MLNDINMFFKCCLHLFLFVGDMTTRNLKAAIVNTFHYATGSCQCCLSFLLFLIYLFFKILFLFPLDIFLNGILKWLKHQNVPFQGQTKHHPKQNWQPC